MIIKQTSITNKHLISYTLLFFFILNLISNGFEPSLFGLSVYSDSAHKHDTMDGFCVLLSNINTLFEPNKQE